VAAMTERRCSALAKASTPDADVKRKHPSHKVAANYEF
jgi:hypothetical protein